MNTLTARQRDRVLALLRQGKTLRQIQAETGHRRETIAAYGRRAGLLGSHVTDLDAARRSAAPGGEQIGGAIVTGLAEGRSLRSIHRELVSRFGFIGSYSAIKRYVRTRRSAGVTTLDIAA